MIKHTENPIPTDSPAYGRRLVKAIRDAFEHGVYYFNWGAQSDDEAAYGERVSSVQYEPLKNLITVRTSEGKRRVGPASWNHFMDGHGRDIVVSRSAR
jgi:hypothetical protein